MSSFAIFNAVFEGIAKPRPSLFVSDDFALTIPIRSPFPLNNPPPELPGETAASV